jgi:hypothetical protein
MIVNPRWFICNTSGYSLVYSELDLRRFQAAIISAMITPITNSLAIAYVEEKARKETANTRMQITNARMGFIVNILYVNML